MSSEPLDSESSVSSVSGCPCPDIDLPSTLTVTFDDWCGSHTVTLTRGEGCVWSAIYYDLDIMGVPISLALFWSDEECGWILEGSYSDVTNIKWQTRHDDDPRGAYPLDFADEGPFGTDPPCGMTPSTAVVS